MRAVVRFSIGILLLAMVVPAYCITFTELGGDDLQGGTSAKIVAGPYLQDMTENAVTIAWESDGHSYGQLTVGAGANAVTYVTSHARRLTAVRVKGLKPDTAYSYAVSVSARQQPTGKPSAAGACKFRTFPAANTHEPLSFIVYGDTRSFPERQRQVINAMAAEPNVEFVLHTGDLVSDARKIEQWIPQFLEPASKLMARVPFYTVLGNHERNSSNYFTFMKMPQSGRWYSFDIADIHIAALDSNMSFDTGSDQYKWLVDDLTRHKNAKWKFLLMHHPAYTSGTHGSLGEDGQPKELPVKTAQKLLPVLAKQFGINAIFAGHDHVYERSTRDGVNYITAGGGGAENYADVNGKNNHYRKVFYSGLHYCVVSVVGNRARMVVKTPEGKIIDKISL